jgi:hypothetical protein
MPKPSVIQAGCGFCLRFLPDDLESVLAALSEQGIKGTETYWMEESDGTVSYSSVPSGSVPASGAPL